METNKQMAIIKNDKYDYLISVCCGTISGIFDIVFVGTPGDSKLGSAIQKASDQYVKKALEFFSDKKEKIDQIKEIIPDEITDLAIEAAGQAIREELAQFAMKYAKSLSMDEADIQEASIEEIVESLSQLSESVGLVFSALNQFVNEEKGLKLGEKQHIAIIAKRQSGFLPYLQGTTPQAKLFCGFINWFSFVLYRIKENKQKIIREDSRITGIAKLFIDLADTFDINIDIEIPNKEQVTNHLIEIFEDGFNASFALASAVPVVMTEVMIRGIWMLRQHFFRGIALEECIPSEKNVNLSRMLLVGNGSFVLIDGAEAAYRGVQKKSWATFISRLNLIGLARFSVLVLKEVSLETGIFTDDSGDPFFERVFGTMTDEDKEKLSVIGNYISSYKEALDVTNALMTALEEHKQAKEERIRIEAECAKKIEEVRKYREEMFNVVEDYFEKYIVAFEQGLSLMEEGIASNDENKFIEGNVLIQETLDYDVQFHNKEEFDSLMEDDDEDFKL